MKKIASTLGHAALFAVIVVVLTAVFLGACAPANYDGHGLRQDYRSRAP